MYDEKLQTKLHLLAFEAAKILKNCEGGNFEHAPKPQNFIMYSEYSRNSNYHGASSHPLKITQKGAGIYVYKSYLKYSVRRLSFAYLIPLAQYIYKFKSSSERVFSIPPEAPIGVNCAIASYGNVTCRLIIDEILRPTNCPIMGYRTDKFYDITSDEVINNALVVTGLRLDVNFQRDY